MIIYLDNYLIFGADESVVNKFLKSLEKAKLEESYYCKDSSFKFTNKSNIESFLSTKIEIVDAKVKIIQPMLIERITKALIFDTVNISTKLILLI